MADAGWAALGGIAVGAIGKGLWDWWLAIGKLKAEREARAEARREKRADRRDDLQRHTLLDLQPALTALLRLTVRTIELEEEVLRQNPNHRWGTMLLQPDGMDEEMRQAFVQVSLLQSRVRDDDLRELVNKLSRGCADMGMSTDRGEVQLMRKALGEFHLAAMKQSGQLIRTIDDDVQIAVAR